MPSETTNPTDNVTQGGVQAPFDISSTIANPDGNSVNAEIKPQTNEVIPSSDMTSSGVIPQAPTTSADAANNVIAASQNIAATAQSEAASQIKTTSDLSQIDKTQVDTKIANAESNFAEAQKIQTDQMIQKNQNEIEYQKQLQDENSAEIANLKMIQASENALNAATAAEMKLKADNAEKDAEIANDVASQSSAIAFAKLGLSFSGAAINTSQQIYAQGARGVAELRSSNAKNYADLRVKIDSVAFDHQAVINKVVADAHEKEFSSKERLREFIGNAQNNILTSKKEAQAAIQDAISTYKTERQAREDKLYSDIGAANKDLLTATQTIQTTINAKQEVVKKEIDSLIANGQWSSLSIAQQTEKELAAGLPVNSVNRTTTTNVTAGINARLKDLVGSAVAIPVVTLNRMQSEIATYMKNGYPMQTAIQMTVDRFKQTIPEVQRLEAANKAKSALTNTKTQAEIDKLKSEAKQNLSEIDIAKAKLALARSSTTSSASSSKEVKGTSAGFVDKDDKPLVLVNGIPHRIGADGKPGAVYGAAEGEIIRNKDTSQDYVADATLRNSGQSEKKPATSIQTLVIDGKQKKVLVNEETGAHISVIGDAVPSTNTQGW